MTRRVSLLTTFLLLTGCAWSVPGEGVVQDETGAQTPEVVQLRDVQTNATAEEHVTRGRGAVASDAVKIGAIPVIPSAPPNIKPSWSQAATEEGRVGNPAPAPPSTATITFYTATDHCAPDDPGARFCDGLTAAMVPADPERRILACPPEMEFGTRVRIEGLGVYTCLDRGGAIRGERFDVLVESRSDALEWGVRRVAYTILNEEG